MNKLRHRINNERFSVRVCNVANYHGFKTVGTLYKAVLNNPRTYLLVHSGTVSNKSLLREIQEYLS